MSRLFIKCVAAVYCVVIVPPGTCAGSRADSFTDRLMLMDDIQTAIDEARQSIEDRIDWLESDPRRQPRRMTAPAPRTRQFNNNNIGADPAALERMIVPGMPEVVYVSPKK